MSNYNQPQTGGDLIAKLPVDQIPPSSHEIQIIDTLFKKHRDTMDIIFEESKDSFLVALLVIVSCLPQIDSMIKKSLPVTERSPYILLLVKGLVTGALFWLIKYFFLSRKS